MSWTLQLYNKMIKFDIWKKSIDDIKKEMALNKIEEFKCDKDLFDKMD